MRPLGSSRYVYGLLHHPGYRERYADCLKRELPRIPFAPAFRAFADAGRELGRLHLDYEQLEPWPLLRVSVETVWIVKSLPAEFGRGGSS